MIIACIRYSICFKSINKWKTNTFWKDIIKCTCLVMPSLLLNQEHFLKFPSQVFLGHLSRTNHLRIHDKGTQILVDIYETKQAKIFHLLMHICYNITDLYIFDIIPVFYYGMWYWILWNYRLWKTQFMKTT